MFYIGFTKVNRFLKGKLEFTSEFLVFLIFGEVFSTFVTAFILIVDFYVIPASLGWHRDKGVEKKHYTSLFNSDYFT